MESEPLPCVDSIQIHVEGFVELLVITRLMGLIISKEVSLEIAPALTLIFQASLDQGKLPEVDQEEGISCFIYKKGNRSDPCNFRPISLTCICAKILEYIKTSAEI